MASVYKNLSDEDLKIEKESLKKFEKKLQESPDNSALKIAVLCAFLFSVVSLAGSFYLYQSLNKEKRQREALETAQTQFQEKATAFEQDAEKTKREMTRLSHQIKSYSSLRQKIAQQLAESRNEVTALQTRLKEVEEKSAAMQQVTEGIQADFDSQPVGPTLSEAGTGGGKDDSEETAPEGPQGSVVNEPAVIKEPQVLSVNRKFNFVVANLGLKDNLEIGDILNVEREGKKVGTVTIEKIYDNFSAATINTQPKDAPFKQGDAVRKA